MSLGCVLLIVGSALLQIGGLFLVARDLWRVQHRELGAPRWSQSIRARWHRLLGRPGTVHRVGLDAAISVESALALRVKRGPGTTLEQQVASLEANLAELDGYAEKRFSDIDQQLTRASQRADEVRAYVDQLRQEQDHARREELRQTLPWQWIGISLFAVGALLAMWSALAC